MADGKNYYSIGKVSALCSVPIKTLRYYDSLSLVIPEIRDPQNNYRYYSDEQVIRLLAGQGHRHIGLLGGNRSFAQISSSRLTGCLEACRRLGLPFDADQQYEPCRYSMPDAYAATLRLLRRRPDLTAIFAVSDVMALGAIRALRDMGRRVPEDTSVVGYDGIVTGQYSLPRLTTVRQDTQQLAERGVDALLRSIQRRSPTVHELVPFHLIEGESVAQLN